MPDLSKYDLILSELSALETQVTVLKDKYLDVSGRNKELEEEVSVLKKENFSLQQKLNRFEADLNKFQNFQVQDFSDSMTEHEKEELKQKIQRMISRIDHHLSS